MHYGFQCSVVVSVIKVMEFNSASVPTTTSHISMLIQHLDEMFTRIDYSSP